MCVHMLLATRPASKTGRLSFCNAPRITNIASGGVHALCGRQHRRQIMPSFVGRGRCDGVSTRISATGAWLASLSNCSFFEG
eukprot:jgi/Botrbrau1/16224/Bobra.0066s0010.1